MSYIYKIVEKVLDARNDDDGVWSILLEVMTKQIVPYRRFLAKVALHFGNILFFSKNGLKVCQNALGLLSIVS